MGRLFAAVFGLACLALAAFGALLAVSGAPLVGFIVAASGLKAGSLFLFNLTR